MTPRIAAGTAPAPATIRAGHLLHDPTVALTAERIEPLLTRPGARIERIVSTGQASPPGFWYDQSEDEFVLLLCGAAGLRFAGEAQAREMHAGDWVEIPAHTRHRVEWTSAAEPTVWLAVFVAADPVARADGSR